MVMPDEFFEESEKINLAEITSTFSTTVHDQESFDDFLHTMRLALDHDEATKLLAMAAAVIASVTRGSVALMLVTEAQAKDN